MRIFIIILVASLAFGAHAQADMEILQEAKEHAEEGSYRQALEEIEEGLSLMPDHHDLLAYQIRLLLWDRQYERAEKLVDQLLELYPDGEVAWEIKLTGLLWQEKWQALLKHANEALTVHPESNSFLLLKAKALIGLHHFEAAGEVLEKIKDPSADRLKAQLLLNEHHYAKVSSTYSRFSANFDPWTVITATYGHTTKHSWDLSASYGQLFGESGMRFNANAYPVISQRFSALVEAGYSTSDIFPNVEAGAELIKVTKAFAFAGGMKFMRFSEAGNVFIYKGSAGYYFDDHYANYRVYYTSVLGNSSLTHLVTLRHFFRNKYHYVQLQGSLGSTPIQINTLLEVQRLDARMVMLSYKHLFKSHKWMLESGFGFQNERYREGQRRDRYTLQLGISRLW